MNYEQQISFKDLLGFISTHTKNKSFVNHNQKAVEENFKWNSSLFIAKAVFLSNLRKEELAVEEFNQFIVGYQDQRRNKIDADDLFKKYWLRNVFGKIKIAGTASSACYVFKRIAQYRLELEFMFSSLEQENELTGEIIEQRKNEYEAEKLCSLDYDWIIQQLSDHNGSDNKNYKLSSYYRPFLQLWEEFEFLSAYKEHLSEIELSGLRIEKKVLQEIHNCFRQFYSETPSISQLIDHELLSEKEEFYQINLLDSKIGYWTALNDEISAHYWQLLIEENGFSDDNDRIKRFLQQTFDGSWSNNFLTSCLPDSKKRFLDAAFNLVINEADLDGVKSEFEKISIDESFNSHKIQSLFINREEYEDFSLDSSDHFELLESLDNWEKKASTTYLYGQSSRDEITHLVKTIITHDYETERNKTELEGSPVTHYKRTFGLLEEALFKPTLLWNIKSFIIMSRRDVIPNLIQDPQYTSFAFQLIDKLGEHLLDEGKDETHKKLWMKPMKLALFSIRPLAHDGRASKLISQIFRQLNSTKYKLPSNRNQPSENYSRKQKEEKEKAILTIIEDSSLHNHKIRGASDQFLIPSLYNQLAQLFVNLPPQPAHNNRIVSFPMLQWDGLIWLMKCSTYWKYKTQFELNPPDTVNIASSFFELYTESIEITKIKNFNFYKKIDEKSLPLWSEKIERLDYIEWFYPICLLKKHDLLDRFLAPTLEFKPTSGKDNHHDWNRFVADKLRTHIGVMLQVLSQLVLPNIPYGFERADILDIKLKIEEQIIRYLKRHIKDIPNEGRVDLFDYYKEWGFEKSEKEALLPQVARSLNWFSQKETVIKAFIDTQDVVKILTLAKWVTSEGVKQKLIAKIQQSDIEIFLRQTHWIPEVQQALLEVSNYPELINEMNQIVKFWEKSVLKKSKKYEVQLYQTKMLLAYFDEDEEKLNTIIEPSSPISAVSELSYYDHKEFYRALIRIKKYPESSYTIFKRLGSQYSQYPVLVINKMAAKINMAKANDDLQVYREALEEWNLYSSEHNLLSIETLRPTLIINKLFILLKIRDYKKLDTLFCELDLPFQMLSDILESKVESLIERKRTEEASILLVEAENYHQFSGEGDNNFIKSMRIRVEGTDNLQLLNSYYTRIFTCPPDKLIRIFPSDLNGQRQIQSFLVTEIASAAKLMLEKVVAFSDVKGEDKYNDVIEILLNSKMNQWGWFVTDQGRGGYSDSRHITKRKQPGERDFKFFNKKDTIGICEAFIYRTPSVAKNI